MRLFSPHCLTAAWVLVVLPCIICASPPVKVRLRSSWAAPNLLLEILESAAIEERNTFFPLLDLLTSPDVFPGSLGALSSQVIHDNSVRTLLDNGYLSEPGALDSFELSLSLHAASPKIEAFYQYYRDHQLAETPLAEGELPSNCQESWVEWCGRRVCSIDTLRHLVEVDTESMANGTSIPGPLHRTKLLSFEHAHPPESQLSNPPPRTAILYGAITSPNFRSLHNYLYSLSKEEPPRLQYVFRHLPPQEERPLPNYLSGYGVTLDLKKMDYLALDDRKHSRGGGNTASADVSSSKHQSEHPEIYDPMDVLGDTVDQVDMATPLNEEETQGIALNCADIVMKSADPLKALLHLSQNFPKYATSLARRVTVDSALSEELERNRQKIQQGYNMAWLNGIALQSTDINIFALVRLLRKEREITGQIKKLGLTAQEAVDLLTHEAVVSSQQVNRVIDGIFDATDRREGGDVILWWNNFEKDSRYAHWSPTLQSMMRPIFPGQFHNIKRNLYNIVLLLDLSQRSSLAWITGPVSDIIQRGYPLRFGVVPLVETEEGKKTARLFYYLIKTYGRSKAMAFLKAIIESPTLSFDFAKARAEFLALSVNTPSSEESDDESAKKLDFDAVIEPTDSPLSQDLTKTLENARRYASRLGASLKSSPEGHTFINGKHADMGESFLTTLNTELAPQVQYLQEQIFVGNLTDSMDTYLHFYDLPTTIARRNRHIYPTDKGSLKVSSLPEIFARAKVQPTPSDFVYPASNPHPPVTIWIVADFDEPSGKALLRNALASLTDDAMYRLGVVHHPSKLGERMPPNLEQTSYRLSRLRAASRLNLATPTELLVALDEGHLSPGDEHARDDDVFDQNSYAEFCRSSLLLAREFGVAAGQDFLVVNGRIVGPIEADEFAPEDFGTLADYEISKRVGPVLQAYMNITGHEEHAGTNFSDNIAKLSSMVSALQIPDPSTEGLFNIPQRPRGRSYRLLEDVHSSFKSGDITTASYQFAFVLDPASEEASRWTPLISWLSRLNSVFLQVYLNPTISPFELPLKQFYRYNLPPKLIFDDSGAEIMSTIEFKDLPRDPIYTLGMDVPTAWLVRPHESHHDLDNIHLASFTGTDLLAGVEAIFDLDYFVVEGHARNPMTNAPPRGLQLQLTTSNSTPIADTQVVANLGYFQFKVKPGVFQLEIRDGYGREVFEIESVGNEGWNSPLVTSAGTDITLTNLEGLTLYPRFRKRPGMETADVLSEPIHDQKLGVIDQVMSSISSILWSNKQTSIATNQADINIFTVASGLLYERFVSIMILSVLRNTKSTVKFWFIENFLSPSFLEFIPHLAEAYHFEYELVTYKWPSWLRAQTEKQRVIWGYKILFLDVLFPMHLKKVIFVDADQIVRADLKELVDLDLHGAPYGYTPMGDDNTEMEGFRFWKTGYWKEFLRDKPYHISALYVIDLVRFRQLAAGDRLRGSYQALSADPNSLSNLDQDLPNNLQHDVPIFSLPEDWLWCETWCSKERLHRAKTIDLCQNPLTKEPKLSRARQIPEWEEYDAEVSRFARKLADEGIIRSTAYASGVDALANLGSTRPAEEPLEVDGEEPEKEDAREQVGEQEVTDSKLRDEL